MPSAPVHTFAGGRLDRAGALRGDADWLAVQLADPKARALAFWNGAPLLRERTPAIAWLNADLAQKLAGGEEKLAFLGLSVEGPVFAIDVEADADPSLGTLEGLGRFVELRPALADLAAQEANLLGTARSLFEWRRKHRFCSVCGQPSRVTDGGWRRVCTACKAQHFPRVDPCVIMLPVQGEHCLLGRQTAWAAGRYSTLAGFVEPGESIEDACAREVKEEAGLTVTAVRYHSSQPWPFPAQLMVGLIAEVAEGEPVPDMAEIAEIRRFTRAQALDLLDGKLEGATSAPPFAIAHHLIRDWAETKL